MHPRRAAWLSFAELALAVADRASGQAVEAFDERCWVQVAQADSDRCDPREPCRSDCWSSVFTHSYCCVADSPCWWWGRAAEGEPVRTDAARSGVECRYLCQAEPRCAEWTFVIPGAAAGPDSFGPCVLHRGLDAGGARLDGAHNAAAAAAIGAAPFGVVGGPRICGAGDSTAGAAFAQAPAENSLESLGGRTSVFHPSDPGFADKAAEALRGVGWAVLRGVLAPPQVEALREAAEGAVRALLDLDPPRLGNRGPRRYSFGGASKTHHMVHLEAWAELLDVPVVLDVLDRAFNGSYVAVGGGGDFVLGDTDTHQRLHVDLQHEEMYSLESPPAAIAANFAVAAVGCQDGPMRIVPGTQHVPLAVAESASGGEAMARASSMEREAVMHERLRLTPLVACPLAPGDVLLRDMRVWHGGTPNRGPSARLLPSAEFLAPWYAELTAGTDDHFAPRPALPFALWARLSARGRAAARRILSAPAPVDAGVRAPFVLLLPYVAEDRP